MKCEDVQAYLPSLIDGDLNDKQSQGLKSHLQTCSECTTVYTDFQRINKELQDVLSPLTGKIVPAADVIAQDDPAQKAPPEKPLQTMGGYEFLEEIGKGAMGTVYKARQISLDRIVAVKVLGDQHVQDKEFVTRFLREARSAGHLNHPSIIRVHDVAKAEGKYFFVMELVDGQSLKEVIAHEGTMEPKFAINLIGQVALGLAHAHKQGLIHRDIKPDNILLTKGNEAKIADLGLARQEWTRKDSGLTATGTVLGTPYYMSPEQAEDSTQVTIQSDIYSLGATLYHMVTGKLPFEGNGPLRVLANVMDGKYTSAHQAQSTVPISVSKFIDRMMAKEPKKRFADCTQVAEAAEKLLHDLEQGKDPAPLTGHLSTAATKAVARQPKIPTFVYLIAAVLLLALGAGIMASVFSEEDPQAGPNDTTVAQVPPTATQPDPLPPQQKDPETTTPIVKPEPEPEPEPKLPVDSTDTPDHPTPPVVDHNTTKARTLYQASLEYLRNNPTDYAGALEKLNLVIRKYRKTSIHPLAVAERSKIKRNWNDHLKNSIGALSREAATLQDAQGLSSMREKLLTFRTAHQGAPFWGDDEGKTAWTGLTSALHTAEDRIFDQMSDSFQKALAAKDTAKGRSILASMKALDIDRKTSALADFANRIQKIDTQQQTVSTYLADLKANPPVYKLNGATWPFDSVIAPLAAKAKDPLFAEAQSQIAAVVAELQSVAAIPDNAMDALESGKRKTHELTLKDGRRIKGMVSGSLGTYTVKTRKEELAVLGTDIHPVSLYALSANHSTPKEGQQAAWEKAHGLYALFVAHLPQAAQAHFDRADLSPEETKMLEPQFETAKNAAALRDFTFNVLQIKDISKAEKAFEDFKDHHENRAQDYEKHFARHIETLKLEEKVMQIFTVLDDPIALDSTFKLNYSFAARNEEETQDFYFDNLFWQHNKTGFNFVYTRDEPATLKDHFFPFKLTTKARFEGDFEWTLTIDHEEAPTEMAMTFGSVTFALIKRPEGFEYALANKPPHRLDADDFEAWPSKLTSRKNTFKFKRDGNVFSVNAHRKIGKKEIKPRYNAGTLSFFANRSVRVKKWSFEGQISKYFIQQRRQRVTATYFAEKAFKEGSKNPFSGTLEDFRVDRGDKNNFEIENNKLTATPFDDHGKMLLSKKEFGPCYIKFKFKVEERPKDHWFNSGVHLLRHQMEITHEWSGSLLGCAFGNGRGVKIKPGAVNEVLFINDGKRLMLKINDQWVYDVASDQPFRGPLGFESNHGQIEFFECEIAELEDPGAQENSKKKRWKDWKNRPKR